MADKEGGLTLEAAITVTAEELDRRGGSRPATQEEIDSQRDLLHGERHPAAGRSVYERAHRRLHGRYPDQ